MRRAEMLLFWGFSGHGVQDEKKQNFGGGGWERSVLSEPKFSWPLWRAARARGSVIVLRRLDSGSDSTLDFEASSEEDGEELRVRFRPGGRLANVTVLRVFGGMMM